MSIAAVRPECLAQRLHKSLETCTSTSTGQHAPAPTCTSQNTELLRLLHGRASQHEHHQQPAPPASTSTRPSQIQHERGTQNRNMFVEPILSNLTLEDCYHTNDKNMVARWPHRSLHAVASASGAQLLVILRAVASASRALLHRHPVPTCVHMRVHLHACKSSATASACHAQAHLHDVHRCIWIPGASESACQHGHTHLFS